MRKILSLISALLFAGLTALWADPADPNPIKVKQPDGSTITLRLHGDEFYNWFTSEDGKTLYSKDAAGWWRPAGKPTFNRNAINQARIKRAERDNFFRQRAKGGLGLGWGDNHFLIILVEWQDYKFQEGAKEYFTNALGQTGFSGNGCTGSAKDFYTDASYGAFTPNFDVYGPVTVTRNHTDWPTGDDAKLHAEMARVTLKEAIDLLDSTVDFSIYDNNNDGYVDNVYMIYPGYPASSGAQNAIWPHASSTYKETNDNVVVRSYGCSSELMGTSGSTFVGIGTFCHEFGHVIGLPDLYDTDYEENGQARHPSSWNLMAGGNHNNSGRTPARMCALERYLLGYLKDTDIVDLSVPGNKTIKTLSEKKFYKLPVPTNEGEFFIAEVRDGTVWDQPLPGGMIIYHIDQSNNMSGDQTAAAKWDAGYSINVHAVHPCDYIVCPDEDAYNGKAIDYYQLWVFPTDEWGGSYYKVYDYSPTAWDGTNPYNLTGINYADGQATFTVSLGERNIVGTITEVKAKTPIKDAVVIVEPQSQQTSGLGYRSRSLAVARRNAIAEATSDANGKYKVTLPDNAPDNLIVSVFAEGYLSEQENVNAEKSVAKNFALSNVIDGLIQDSYSKATFPLTNGKNWGWNKQVNLTAAIKYTAAELKNYVGQKLTEIAFGVSSAAEEAQVIVEFGNQRVLAKTLNGTLNTSYSDNVYSPANVVDVSEDNIVIPANTDILVGYALKNTSGYPLLTDGDENTSTGVVYLYLDYTGATAGGDKWFDPIESWGMPQVGYPVISFKLKGDLTVNPNAKLIDFGICYIDLPSTLSAGNSLPLKLVYSKANKPGNIVWSYDGATVNGESVTLTAGSHTITAKYEDASDGSIKKVEARIDVQ